MGPSPPARRARQIAVAVVILAALAGAFLLTGPIITALHGMTGGSRAGGAAAGVLLVLAPMAVVIGYAHLARTRGWPEAWTWWLLLLYLPALDLEPFGRSGTNTGLQHRIDSELPGLLGGMVAGVLLLMAVFLLPALVVALRKRRGEQSRRG